MAHSGQFQVDHSSGEAMEVVLTNIKSMNPSTCDPNELRLHLAALANLIQCVQEVDSDDLPPRVLSARACVAEFFRRDGWENLSLILRASIDRCQRPESFGSWPHFNLVFLPQALREGVRCLLGVLRHAKQEGIVVDSVPLLQVLVAHVQRGGDETLRQLTKLCVCVFW